MRRFGRAPLTLPEPVGPESRRPVYQRILVPLDHTRSRPPGGRPCRGHGAAASGASCTCCTWRRASPARSTATLSSTAEVEAGQKYLDEIVRSLQAESIEVVTKVAHSSNPKKEIIRYAGQVQPDLLIMGAHGHKRLKDLIFGNTIDPVRHALSVPILVVRG